MKQLFLLLSIFLSIDCYAQLPANFNLVPNGRFNLSRDYLFNDTTFSTSACWIKANGSTPISQYPGFTFYDTTLKNLVTRLDSTYWGVNFFQNPIAFVKNPTRLRDTSDITPSLKRYAQNRLLQPLVAGKTYRFTMYVTEIDYSAAALAGRGFFTGLPIYSVIRNLGVYFSSTKVANYTTTRRLNYTPQVNFRGWANTKLDTVEKIKLTGTYLATGGEQYITIGNFDYAKDFVYYNNWPSYYPDTFTINNQNYITDVSLVEDSTLPLISLNTFSLGKDTTICPGTPITIGGEPYFLSYLWNTGATSRQISVTAPGTYWCTVDFGCGQETDTLKIFNTPLPAAFDIRDTVLCPAITFNLSAPAGYFQYLWSTGATAQQGMINTQGVHWVRIGNACNNYYTDSFRVTPSQFTVPGININTIPPNILCNGTAITFVTNNTGAGSNPSFQWYKNGVIIPGATATTYTDANLANADTLSIIMYSSAFCPVTQPTLSNKVGVTVAQILEPKISLTASPGLIVNAGQPITFFTTPVNGGTNPNYTWYLNGNIIPGVNGGSWTFNTPHEGDNIQVRLETKIPCPTTPFAFSSTLTTHLNTGVEQTGIPNSLFRIYPNPVEHELTIDFVKMPASASFVILDQFGRICTPIEQIESTHTRMDISAFAAGVYWYRISIDGIIYHGKMLKR